MTNEEYTELLKEMTPAIPYTNIIRGLEKGTIARVEDITSSKQGIRRELLASAILLNSTRVIRMILDAEGVKDDGLSLNERITLYQLLDLTLT